MAMLDGYNQAIDGASVRMKLMIQVTERLDALGRETRSGLLASGFDVAANGTGRNLAEQRMREALDHLNKEVNGRYMFAGRSTEAAPVNDWLMSPPPAGTAAGPAVGEAGERLGEVYLVYSTASRVPITAWNSAPPKSRCRSLEAEPMPARATGTEPISELEEGGPARPIPSPSTP